MHLKIACSCCGDKGCCARTSVDLGEVSSRFLALSQSAGLLLFVGAVSPLALSLNLNRPRFTLSEIRHTAAHEPGSRLFKACCLSLGVVAGVGAAALLALETM
jgi:hypothetical protein